MKLKEVMNSLLGKTAKSGLSLEELKADVMRLEDERLDLRIKSEELERQQDKFLSRAVKAQRAGNVAAAEDAAGELNSLKETRIMLNKKKNKVRGALSIARRDIAILELSGSENIASDIVKKRQNTEHQKQLGKARAEDKMTSEIIRRENAKGREQFEDDDDAMRSDLSDEMALIRELAQAEETGDVDKAFEMNERLKTGKAPKKAEADLEDDLKL